MRARFPFRLSLLTVLAAAGFILSPMPSGKPDIRVEEALQPGTTSPRHYPFRLYESRPKITVRCSSRLSQGRVRFALITEQNNRAQWQLIGNRNFTNTFNFGKPCEPGLYTIEITAEEAVGRIHVDVVPPALLTPWQRLLMVMAAFAAVAGFRYWLMRRGGHTAPGALKNGAWVFRASAFGLVLCLLYPAIHEAGHALPLALFGAFSPERSDFLGLGGAPHAGLIPDARLLPWQRSVISMGGPILPTLTGWLLFLAWLLLHNRRPLRSSIVLKSMWLWTSGALLIGQFGMLIPMLGVAQDGDYSGYAGNFPGPNWIANTILIVLIAINALVLWRIARRLQQMSRQWAVSHATGPGLSGSTSTSSTRNEA